MNNLQYKCIYDKKIILFAFVIKTPKTLCELKKLLRRANKLKEKNDSLNNSREISVGILRRTF